MSTNDNNQTLDTTNQQEELSTQNTEETTTEAVVEQPKAKKRFRKPLIIFLLFIIAFIAGAVAFYYLYWIKSPTYTIGIIRESIQKHDVAAFDKHVDLNEVSAQAWDALAAEELTANNMADSDSAKALTLFLKPTIISAIKGNMNEYVRTGNFSFQNPLSGILNPKVSPEQMKPLLDDKTLDNFDFVDVKNVNTTDNKTTADLVLFDKKIKKEIVIGIGMSQLPDGTWIVDRLTNLNDFIQAISQNSK